MIQGNPPSSTSIASCASKSQCIVAMSLKFETLNSKRIQMRQMNWQMNTNHIKSHQITSNHIVPINNIFADQSDISRLSRHCSRWQAEWWTEAARAWTSEEFHGATLETRRDVRGWICHICQHSIVGPIRSTVFPGTTHKPFGNSSAHSRLDWMGQVQWVSSFWRNLLDSGHSDLARCPQQPRFGQFIQFDYGQATFGMPDHVKTLAGRLVLYVMLRDLWSSIFIYDFICCIYRYL